MVSLLQDWYEHEYHVVSIHFRFGQDEETLEVWGFGHYIMETRPERWGPPDPDNPYPPDDELI
jgi:hypothetical protein